MTNTPFEALQAMYLFDPMSGLPRPEANPKLVEIALRKRNEDEVKCKLENLLKDCKLVDKAPDWKSCLNVSWEDGYENQDIILSILSGSLVYKCLPPLEIVKSKNTVWVRTGN